MATATVGALTKALEKLIQRRTKQFLTPDGKGLKNTEQALALQREIDARTRHLLTLKTKIYQAKKEKPGNVQRNTGDQPMGFSRYVRGAVAAPLGLQELESFRRGYQEGDKLLDPGSEDYIDNRKRLNDVEAEIRGVRKMAKGGEVTDPFIQNYMDSIAADKEMDRWNDNRFNYEIDRINEENEAGNPLPTHQPFDDRGASDTGEAAKYGLSNAPGGLTSFAGMLMEGSPVNLAVGKLTGKDMADRMYETAQETTDYWHAKVSPGYEPDTAWEEFVAFSTEIGADPWIVGTLAGMSARSAAKVMAKGGKPAKDLVSKVVNKMDKPYSQSRRDFNKTVAASGGIGAVGGIAALGTMSKGGAKAASKVKPGKLMSMEEWQKAGRPNALLKGYQERAVGINRTYDTPLATKHAIRGSDELVNRSAYNNYVRSTYKELKKGIGAKETAKMEKIMKDWNIPWRVIERQNDPKVINNLYKKFKLNPDIPPSAYGDLTQAVRARNTFKGQMDQYEKAIEDGVVRDHTANGGTLGRIFRGDSNEKIIQQGVVRGESPEHIYGDIYGQAGNYVSLKNIEKARTKFGNKIRSTK